MTQKQKKDTQAKQGLHSRNKHRFRYDFPALIKTSPELKDFVSINQYQNESIDFADPRAVKALNSALLKHFYSIDYWEIPKGYLCPPIPGRADYIHHIADLLASSNQGQIPEGSKVRALDIGVGANSIYPIIGSQAYGWQFIGTEVDPIALNSAQKILDQNQILKGKLELRLQSSKGDIFRGAIKQDELFDISICNPPFHSSAREAAAGTNRKLKNLGLRKQGDAWNKQENNGSKPDKPILNFGGQKTELWCKGGEEAFIRRMIKQSVQVPKNCFWFSSLVSKKSSLEVVYQALKKAKAFKVKTINMAQGQKTSRIIAWTFLNEEEQRQWRKNRW